MSIVSSTLEFDRVQADGRRWVRVRHVDHLGQFHHVAKKVADGTVIATAIAEQQTQLAAELAHGERRALHHDGPSNNDLLTTPIEHTERPPMLRFVIRRGFREYMDRDTTINRRARLAQFLEPLPANQVATQLGVPVAKVNSLQSSMARLLALQSVLGEFVGEIRP